MTNTKEYNEAVEKLADIINKKRVFVPKFDDYEPRIQEGLRDTIKVIIDALGIEIVSNKSVINDRIFQQIYYATNKLPLADFIDWCKDNNAGGRIDSLNKQADAVCDLIFNKPAVYVENIKGAE